MPILNVKVSAPRSAETPPSVPWGRKQSDPESAGVQSVADAGGIQQPNGH